MIPREHTLSGGLAYWRPTSPSTPASIPTRLVSGLPVLEGRAGVALDPAGMQSRFLAEADHQHELTDWDRDQLWMLTGRAGAFEPLRRYIEQAGHKGEQETYQRRLRVLFESMS